MTYLIVMYWAQGQQHIVVCGIVCVIYTIGLNKHSLTIHITSRGCYTFTWVITMSMCIEIWEDVVKVWKQFSDKISMPLIHLPKLTEHVWKMKCWFVSYFSVHITYFVDYLYQLLLVLTQHMQHNVKVKKMSIHIYLLWLKKLIHTWFFYMQCFKTFFWIDVINILLCYCFILCTLIHTLRPLRKYTGIYIKFQILTALKRITRRMM